MPTATKLYRVTDAEHLTILAALENFAHDLGAGKIDVTDLQGQMLTTGQDVTALWNALTKGDCTESDPATPIADAVLACANTGAWDDTLLFAARGMLAQVQTETIDACVAIAAAQQGSFGGDRARKLKDAAAFLSVVEPMYTPS